MARHWRCSELSCRPMLGMGGAARQTIHDEAAALQTARNHPKVLTNWAGGDPEARPMAGPEGFAPIPRWATHPTPRWLKDRSSATGYDEVSDEVWSGLEQVGTRS